MCYITTFDLTWEWDNSSYLVSSKKANLYFQKYWTIALSLAKKRLFWDVWILDKNCVSVCLHCAGVVFLPWLKLHLNRNIQHLALEFTLKIISPVLDQCKLQLLDQALNLIDLCQSTVPKSLAINSSDVQVQQKSPVLQPQPRDTAGKTMQNKWKEERAVCVYLCAGVAGLKCTFTKSKQM